MKNFTKTSFLLILTLCVTCLVDVKAQTLPRLDNTFGTGGIIRPSFGGRPAGFSHVLPLPNGKYIVTGSLDMGRTDMLVTRFNHNGSIDSTFRGSHVGYDLTGSLYANEWGRMTLKTNDNKLICIGDFENPNNLNRDSTAIMVFKLDSTGLSDPTWRPNNRGYSVISEVGQKLYAVDAKIMPDNKILIAIGKQLGFDVSSFRIARLNPDGSRDLTFGTNGYAGMYVQYSTIQLFSMDVSPTGEILVSGWRQPQIGARLWFLMKFNADGSVNTTFGNNGVVDLNSFNYNGSFILSPYKVGFLDDGKIILSSMSKNTTNPSAYTYNVHVARFLANGQLDLSYGTNGYTEIECLYYEQPIRFLLQPDQKIIVSKSGSNEVALYRFNSNGSLDNNFGVNGKFSIPSQNSDTIAVNQIAMTGDGSVLLAGYHLKLGGGEVFFKKAFLARVLTDINLGIVNNTDKASNLLIYPNPIEQNAEFKYTLITGDYVQISLYDKLGRLVHTYLKDELKEAGEHKLPISLSVDLPSDTYYLSLKTSTGSTSVLIQKK